MAAFRNLKIDLSEDADADLTGDELVVENHRLDASTIQNIEEAFLSRTMTHALLFHEERRKSSSTHQFVAGDPIDAIRHQSLMATLFSDVEAMFDRKVEVAENENVNLHNVEAFKRAKDATEQVRELVMAVYQEETPLLERTKNLTVKGLAELLRDIVLTLRSKEPYVHHHLADTMQHMLRYLRNRLPASAISALKD